MTCRIIYRHSVRTRIKHKMKWNEKKMKNKEKEKQVDRWVAYDKYSGKFTQKSTFNSNFGLKQALLFRRKTRKMYISHVYSSAYGWIGGRFQTFHMVHVFYFNFSNVLWLFITLLRFLSTIKHSDIGANETWKQVQVILGFYYFSFRLASKWDI